MTPIVPLLLRASATDSPLLHREAQLALRQLPRGERIWALKHAVALIHTYGTAANALNAIQHTWDGVAHVEDVAS